MKSNQPVPASPAGRPLDLVAALTRAKTAAAYHAKFGRAAAFYEIIKELDAALAVASPSAPVHRFDELRSLPQGWDGYHAQPLNPAAIEKAETFLQRVSVVPCMSGGVQLEWHTFDLDMEIEFTGDGLIEVYAKAVSDSVTVEIEQAAAPSLSAPAVASPSALAAKFHALTAECAALKVELADTKKWAESGYVKADIGTSYVPSKGLAFAHADRDEWKKTRNGQLARIWMERAEKAEAEVLCLREAFPEWVRELERSKLEAERRAAALVEALRQRASQLEDAAFHFQTCRACRADGEFGRRTCLDGQMFDAFMRGVDE